MEDLKARHLSLVSTKIGGRIEEFINATDWLACSVCGQEYRAYRQPDGTLLCPVLVEGVCDICRAERETTERILADVFGPKRVLISMSKAKFETTAENSKAYIAARDFDPVAENLYLHGPTGTGKTMLAAKIILQSIRKSRSCAFKITEEWLRSLYGATGQEQQASIDRLVSVRVLVFDDIGIEPSTEFSARALYDVINSRMLAGRNGLVMTGNFDLDGLASRMQDDRIASRIGGMCGDRVIEIKGSDRRQP